MLISQNKSVVVWGEKTIPTSCNKCVVNIADAVGAHSYLPSIYFHELGFAIASSHGSLPECSPWLVKPSLHGHDVHLILATRWRSSEYASDTGELPEFPPATNSPPSLVLSSG